MTLSSKDRIFTNFEAQGGISLSLSQERGDWKDTGDIIKKGRDWVVQEVKTSGLRGRGPVGALTGAKWELFQNVSTPSYLIVNANESSPGTAKDRHILRYEPHKLLEGALFAGFASKASRGYIYVRGEYVQEIEILYKALQEAYDARLLGKNAAGSGYDFDLFIHRGAGAHICGEETALFESLEGRKGFPRAKPPFPEQNGLYGCPTLVNNVETLAVVPTLLRRGASWFSSLGTLNNRGTKVFCVSGHVNQPCIVEEEMGISIRELIDTYAKGVRGGWNNLLAIIPGGASVPLVPKSLCENLSLDFESLRAVHSDFGTGGIIVMDKSTDIIKATERLSKFYMQESCGQCVPCREGTGWMWRRVEKFSKEGGSEKEREHLQEMSTYVAKNSKCGLGGASASPIWGLLQYFSSEIEERFKKS